jgi:RNA polymerase sigma factor (sigma-70 family)
VLAQECAAIGDHYVQRHALTHEEAQDCAAEFTYTMLRWCDTPAHHDFLHRLAGSERRTWLRRCAHNHTLNFTRSVCVRRRCELFLSDLTMGSERADAREIADSRAAPHRPARRRAACSRIEEALNYLRPAPRRLLLAFYLEGHSVAEIAQAEQLSVSEVNQRLYRGRQSLRRRLLELGETAESLLNDLDLSITPYPLSINVTQGRFSDDDEHR